MKSKMEHPGKSSPIVIEIDIPKPTKADAKLEECRWACDAGVIGAILPALIECRKVPLPDWLFSILTSMVGNHLVNMSGGRKGRHARWIQQQGQDVIDLLSHRAVYELRCKGLRGDSAIVEAVEILRRDFPKW